MNLKLLCLTFIGISALLAAPLKPYIFIGESGKSVEKTKSKIIQSVFFSDQAFEIIGSYNPEDDPGKLVMIITSPILQRIIEKSPDTAAYLAGIHLAITAKGEMTYLTCQNPEYWANAYLQDNYQKFETDVQKFKKEFLKMMPKLRMRIDLEFGSSTGLLPEEIRSYKYKRKAAQFSDSILLGKFSNFDEAVKTIDSNLENSNICKVVYRNKIEGKNVQIFGIGLAGEKGESYFMNIFDTGDKKATSFLPYEILIIENEIYMLDARYLLAIAFPDQPKKIYAKTKSVNKSIKADLKTLLKR